METLSLKRFKFKFDVESLPFRDFSTTDHLYAWTIFFASLLITGYAVYVGNHSLQIPLVHWINDNSLYPNDPFGETLQYYASSVWYIIAWVARVIPLEAILFIGFLVTRLLIIYTAGYLAKTFAPQSQLGFVAAMTLFALDLEGPTLGGNSLVSNYFEQTSLSIPLFLLGFACFHRQRPWMVAILVALGFNCNSMFGVYALTYLGAAFLLNPIYLNRWKTWIAAFGLFLVLALPGILITLSAFGKEAGDKNLWYITSFVRFPHHLFPLTWNPIEYGKFFVLTFLIVGLLFSQRQAESLLFRNCLSWIAMSFLWLGYAFFAAYVAKSPSMLVMHPGRSLTLWYGVAAVVLITRFALQIESPSQKSLRLSSTVALSAAVILWHPIVGPYILAAAILVISVPLVWRYVLREGDPNWLSLVLTVVIVLTGFFNIADRFMAQKNLATALMIRPRQQQVDITDWAKNNTQKDEQFLVSPHDSWQYFRALSQRSVFTSWKDGSAILWDRRFVTPWVERLAALGFDIRKPGLTYQKATQELDQLYKNMDDATAQRLSQQYGLDYWVVSQKKESTFPTVFENRQYKILKLGS